MSAGFVITPARGFESGSGRMVEVYNVKRTGQADWQGVQVWWDGDMARCVDCSGPLAAMSASCKHARAVKRFKTKAEK